jgi:hypothetical protein
VRHTIDVTADDIAAGKRRNCFECPIALALERAFGEPCQVEHGYATVRGRRLMMPFAACRFVERFDGGDPAPAPFVFDLDIPEVAR